MSTCLRSRRLALVALAGLLSATGCSRIVRRPSFSSVVADVSGVLAVGAATPMVVCGLTSDPVEPGGSDFDTGPCFGPALLAVGVGLPLALISGISGTVALVKDRRAADRRAPPAALAPRTPAGSATALAR